MEKFNLANTLCSEKPNILRSYERVTIRATSVLKLRSDKIDLTISYGKGALLKNVIMDLLPMLVTEMGPDAAMELFRSEITRLRSEPS